MKFDFDSFMVRCSDAWVRGDIFVVGVIFCKLFMGRIWVPLKAQFCLVEQIRPDEILSTPVNARPCMVTITCTQYRVQDSKLPLTI